ncbi:LacI family DNA-binding transcriptional regulator [Puniceicoccus vermicola]|uniref:LacI family DNA-binding transcriptional regulator n=1 Tax=Puniceicoccus vermicola TaxID=388746 RepID=A0A7X1AZ53_9BACT|nr:LacI family DNA-binding transcriptional regulator [Puniceicoccus vermicola]MBC2602641.1 LacI family DNA-binding transcriptional regulator [Puniceicoccus vermicola]
MRVNLRTVAAEAGVSVATASIALRGLKNIKPETKQRVLEAARQLGYVRDPQLASALTFVRQKEKAIFRETLAFMADVPNPRYSEYPWLEEEFRGASEYARANGYQLERHPYPDEKKQQMVLNRQLKARGIRGLVITPALKRGPFRLSIDWENFIAVEIGQTLIEPNLPEIIHDVPDDYAHMFEELRLRGYNRIGFTITKHDEIRRHWAMMSAYLVFQHKHKELHKLQPLESPTASWSNELLAPWFRREKPDVIVTNGPHLGRWLHQIGRCVPDDVGICRIDAMNGPDSGLRPNYIAMGYAAIETLASRLERNTQGRHTPNSVLSIPNFWFEGKSLRPRPQSAPAMGLRLYSSSSF